MQLSLFTPPADPLACALWCRPCLDSAQRFVLGLPAPLPLGLAVWLRQHCRVLAVQPLPSGTVAVLVWVPDVLLSRFRALPAGHGGSFHESNQLPW